MSLDLTKDKWPEFTDKPPAGHWLVSQDGTPLCTLSKAEYDFARHRVNAYDEMRDAITEAVNALHRTNPFPESRVGQALAALENALARAKGDKTG